MTGEILHPDEFLASYSLDVLVKVGNGMDMTLGQALEAERLFCPADIAKRQDVQSRVTYLAGMLAAAGSLLPEHEAYVQSGE